MSDQYYLQCQGHFAGDFMLWWRKERRGYTYDLKEAHIFTREEAYSQNKTRETDIPWPKDYIDQRVSHSVSIERVKLKPDNEA